MQWTRREFTKMILGAAALGLVETSSVAKVFGQTQTLDALAFRSNGKR